MRRSVRAAVVALLAAAAVVISIVVTRGPATTDVVLAGTRLAPAASATAKLHATPSGLAIELDVSGLPPSPPGFYYQAWMKGPHGLVTIGTFHMRGGPGTVELWSAVSLADYPAITVTREPEDGNPASSGQVVLTSRVREEEFAIGLHRPPDDPVRRRARAPGSTRRSATSCGSARRC